MAASETILERLQSERRLRQQRGTPGPEPRDADAAWQRYRKALRRLVDDAEAIVREELEPHIERRAREREDAPRQGALSGEERQAVERARERIRKLTRLQEVRRTLERVARDIDDFSARDMARVLGVELPDVETAGQRQRFADRNERLVQDLGEQMGGEALTVMGVAAGAALTADAVRDHLRKRMDVARSRADLIADTEVTSASADFNRDRKRSAGITREFWSTSGDARVRPSHARVDGQPYPIDEGLEVDGVKTFPGSPPRCRCRARPDLSALEGRDPQEEQERQAREAAQKRVRMRQRAREILKRRRNTLRRPRTGERVQLSPRQAEVDARWRALKRIPNLRERATFEERRDYRNWEWVHGANRPQSVAMKRAAREQFNLDGVVHNPRGFKPRRRDIDLAREDLARIYEETQRTLQQQGQRRIRLYRGIKRQTATDGALESWTADPDVARSFAGSRGRVMVEDVPIERVLMGKDSPGWVHGIHGDQAEYVVMQ